MPTYHEVMSSDLSKLADAADKWVEMAGKFKSIEKQYERDVYRISLGQSWVGQSADAANYRFSVTLKELQGAQKEAKAIASILRDSHTQLAALRGRVNTVCSDAIKDGMRISDQGVVSFDTEQLSQSARTAYAHDPGYHVSVRAQVTRWADPLHRAVQAVTDADDGIRLALAAAVVDSDIMDGTMNGFNRSPARSPYPSLEEAGKAANMPKGRAAVAEWWRDLDPVTRGILLRERGDDLREAGIMAPLYEWRPADAGSGPFDTEAPTAHDLWVLTQAQAIATGGDVTGEVAASRNMQHYLSGTGEPLDLDVNRILHADSGFRTDVGTLHIAENQEAWRQKALDEFEKAAWRQDGRRSRGEPGGRADLR